MIRFIKYPNIVPTVQQSPEKIYYTKRPTSPPLINIREQKTNTEVGIHSLNTDMNSPDNKKEVVPLVKTREKQLTANEKPKIINSLINKSKVILISVKLQIENFVIRPTRIFFNNIKELITKFLDLKIMNIFSFFR